MHGMTPVPVCARAFGSNVPFRFAPFPELRGIYVGYNR